MTSKYDSDTMKVLLRSPILVGRVKKNLPTKMRTFFPTSNTLSCHVQYSELLANFGATNLGSTVVLHPTPVDLFPLPPSTDLNVRRQNLHGGRLRKREEGEGRGEKATESSARVPPARVATRQFLWGWEWWL